MTYEKTKENGRIVYVVTMPDGTVYRLPELSTKPLDPKLKAEGKQRARAMKVGFERAIRKANKLGVPLQDIIPVS